MATGERFWKVGKVFMVLVAAVAGFVLGTKTMAEDAGAVSEDSELFGGFFGMDSFEERLRMIGPVSGEAFVEGRLSELFGRLSGDGFEESLFRASVLQYLDDLPGAFEEIRRIEPEEVPEEWREAFFAQKLLWVSELGNYGEGLPLYRRAFGEKPTEENRRNFVLGLLEAGEKGELLAVLEGREERLAEEAEFWRLFYPEFREREWLREISAILLPEFEKGEVEARFAAGELWYFLGEEEKAREVFRAVFMEEVGESGSWYRRLNGFFHDRYAVMNRMAQADGSYGSGPSREYAFFGLRGELSVDGRLAARDAALNYLREMEVREGGSREFLRWVKSALDRTRVPAGERILAFAQAGAPGWVLEEVAGFVESGRSDAETVEFALQAINRFVLSTEKFPELRNQMHDLARRVVRKLPSDESREVRERVLELGNRISRRLGFDRETVGERSEAGRDPVFVAIDEGNLWEAEEILRKEGRNGDRRMLYLAQAWQREGEEKRSAALVGGYLRWFYPDPFDLRISPPLRLGGFAGELPELWREQQEMLGEAFSFISGLPEVWAELGGYWREEWPELAEEERAGAVALQTVFYRWMDERENWGKSARRAFGVENPELRLWGAWAVALSGGGGEAIPVLEELISEEEVGERARRLLFALVVEGGDSGMAVRLAEDLGELSLGVGDRVEVAAGLFEVGEIGEAADWLERVEREELGGGALESYRSVWLRILEKRERAGAVSFAREILLSELPAEFGEILRPVRIEALGLLEKEGELGDYEKELEEMARFAPGSVPLMLLLGELAEFGGDLEKAAGWFRRVAEREGDLRIEAVEWLDANGFAEEAVVEYRLLLENEAAMTLMSVSDILRVFGEAGELDYLVGYFEKWRQPEAGSLDRFYGLQPTAHIFEALAEKLVENGEAKRAIRALEVGLGINPVPFGERMRVSLARLYEREGKAEKVVGLIVDYVTERNPDPEIYYQQPFATALPRWLSVVSERGEGGVPGELLEITGRMGMIPELEEAILRLVEEEPENCSAAVFDIWLRRREGKDWRRELEAVGERFSNRRGPMRRVWEEVERLFDVRGDSG